MLDLSQKIIIFEELLDLDNLEEIDKRVKLVLSKIAKHEHGDCISNIIENYIN